MASINKATREIVCKIVYYGPGMSGKTTNLQVIHRGLPEANRGQLVSLDTQQERTLFFDFLPIDLGAIEGFETKFQLYTVPGQVYYNATRKLVLRGVDGIVFVADSQLDKMAENQESLQNLRDNLAEYGYRLEEIPLVFQYNKQDLPGALSLADMDAALNPGGHVPSLGAVACQGVGVKDTLKLVASGVLDRLRHQLSALASVNQPSPPAMAAAAPPTAHLPPPRLSAKPRALAGPAPGPGERAGGRAGEHGAGDQPRATGAGPATAGALAAGRGKLIDPNLVRQHRPVLRRRQDAPPPPPPALNFEQRCEVWWGRLCVGRGRLRVETRKNLDGEGAYLLSGQLRLWGLWRRGFSTPAEPTSPQAPGRWTCLRLACANGHRADTALVAPGEPPAVWVRLGRLRLTPPGAAAWPETETAPDRAGTTAQPPGDGQRAIGDEPRATRHEQRATSEDEVHSHVSSGS